MLQPSASTTTSEGHQTKLNSRSTLKSISGAFHLALHPRMYSSYITSHYHRNHASPISVVTLWETILHTAIRHELQFINMTKQDHSEGGRVTKHMSRRQEKKAAKKRERAQSSSEYNTQCMHNSPLIVSGVLADAAAALRNSRARRLHQIIRKPGRGGLTPQAAQQLQNYFSKNAPKSEKLSLREMDESAAMIMLQLAAEEAGGGGLSYGDLRKVAEELSEKDGEGGREEGKVEKDAKTEEATEAKESRELKEGRGLGDDVAKEFKLCIRSAKN